MNNIKNVFFIVIIALLPYLAEASDNECLENRTVFEIGSGSTKAANAIVDHCNKKIVQILSTAEDVLPLQSFLELSPDRATFKVEDIAFSVEKIKSIEQKLGVNCKKVKCVGIATAAMRASKNNADFIKAAKDQLNINIEVIPQEEEGELGYISAIYNSSKITDIDFNKPTLVLDIGGGSYQVTYKNSNDQIRVFNGGFGSGVFTSMVVDLIKSYDYAEYQTPNPMSKQEVKDAVFLARKAIGEPILGNHGIRHLFKMSNNEVNIIGVGSFLNKSIAYATDNEKVININELNNLITNLTFKSDDHIMKFYPKLKLVASNVLPNAIFIKGIMDSLKASKIYLLNINNTDGILLTEDYWD